MWRLVPLLAGPAALYLTNRLSYRILKRRVLRRQEWDLNICCGKTDGGGINADIIRHNGVANFVELEQVNRLPFRDGQFRTVLCSHTLEHVERPDAFYDELQRVGKEVVVVLPPLWDLSAALNVLEHKWIFLTLRKEHTELPPYVRLPLARTIHRRFGQRIKACGGGGRA